MDFYSASVALLWSTAMSFAAPSGRPIAALAKSRRACALRSGACLTNGPANRMVLPVQTPQIRSSTRAAPCPTPMHRVHKA
jgi:hypothetical protein